MSARENGARVALVTGGGRGIGRAAALALAHAGANVTVTARTRDEVAAVAAEIGGDFIAALGGDRRGLRGDRRGDATAIGTHRHPRLQRGDRRVG